MEEAGVEQLTREVLRVSILQALHKLGGAGTGAEIRAGVIDLLKLPAAGLQVWHDDRRTQLELDYRLAWERTYLKQCGALENPRRGYWKLSEAVGEWQEITAFSLQWHCRGKKKRKPEVYSRSESE